MSESGNKKITVLIVDDHALVREGLQNFLELHDGIEVVAEASNGQEAIEQTRRLAPDVILMDLVMPEMDGLAAAKEIRQLNPETKVIALTSFDEEDKVIAAIKAGAAGYLLKSVSPRDLVRAIENVYRGDVHLHPAIAKKLMAQVADTHSKPIPFELTKRELEVLRLIANGLRNQDIAVELGIVVKTVKVHVSNILKKLGVADRTQAAVYAIRMGLVSDDPPSFMN